MNDQKRMCGGCHTPKLALGGGLITRRGFKTWICAACRSKVNTKPKPPTQPQGAQT